MRNRKYSVFDLDKPKWQPEEDTSVDVCRRRYSNDFNINEVRCVGINLRDVGYKEAGEGGAGRFLDFNDPMTKAIHVVCNSLSGFSGLFLHSTPVLNGRLGSTDSYSSGVNLNEGVIEFITGQSSNSYRPRVTARYDRVSGDYTGHFDHLINGHLSVNKTLTIDSTSLFKDDVVMTRNLLVEETLTVVKKSLFKDDVVMEDNLTLSDITKSRTMSLIYRGSYSDLATILEDFRDRIINLESRSNSYSSGQTTTNNRLNRTEDDINDLEREDDQLSSRITALGG